MEAFERFGRSRWACLAAGDDSVLGVITDRVAEHLIDAGGPAAGLNRSR